MINLNKTIKELTDLHDVLSVGFEESEDNCETFPVVRSESEAVRDAIHELNNLRIMRKKINEQIKYISNLYEYDMDAHDADMFDWFNKVLTELLEDNK